MNFGINHDVGTFVDAWTDNSKFIEVKTSGSTGMPKLIKHRKEAMKASARMTCDFLGLQPGMTALICLSTRNIAGMMMVVRTLERQLKVLTAEPGSHPLKDVDPGTVIDFCAMVPAQVYNSLMVPEEKEKLKLIRNLIVGGAPVSYSLQQMIQELPGKVYATFGMTETLSHIAMRRLNGAEASEDYTLMEGITIETGEIESNQAEVPEAHEAASGTLIIHVPYLPEEKVVTNDLVQITGPRTFRWLGRKDHVINTGGYKIIPEQIEELIAREIFEFQIPDSRFQNQDSLRYFISSIPDDKLGERVVLVIENKGNEISEKAMTDYLREKLPVVLARHEMPREFLFTEKFTETPTRKIIRSATMKRIITL